MNTKSHIGSRLALKDLLVPTDNNTIGLWHFDKHMYSTNIIPPSVNTARIQPGKFGNSALVQEATENLHGPTFTPGSSWSGTITVEDVENSTRMWHKRIHSVSGNPYSRVIIPCLINTTYTFSIYIRKIYMSDSSYVNIYMRTNTSSNSLIRINGSDLTNEFKKFEVSHATPSDAGHIERASIQCYMVSGEIIEFADWQIEQRGYSTPFISDSTPDQQLMYDNISPAKTICCYFKLGSIEERPNGNDREILRFQDEYSNKSQWRVYIKGGSKDIHLWCRNSQQNLDIKEIIVYNSSINVYDNNWHFLCVRFDDTQMYLTIDDYTVNLDGNPETPWTTPPIFPAQELGIGCPVDGFFGRPSNIYIDELRIDSVFYDDAEIEAWQISNKPFYDPYDYSITAE